MAGAEKNETAFDAWIAEREAASDWASYVRRGVLNRSEIKAECKFSRSVLGSNPAIKEKLYRLEERLRERGVLPTAEANGASRNHSQTASGSAAVEARILSINSRTEQRVKVLEEENAALRAELRELREQLKRYRHVGEHLARTGRLVHP